MGSVGDSGLRTQSQVAAGPARLSAEVQQDVLAPMLAGARARGIADALKCSAWELSARPPAERVLYASARAREAMTGTISVVSDHLVGDSAESNAALRPIESRGLSSGRGESHRRRSLRPDRRDWNFHPGAASSRRRQPGKIQSDEGRSGRDGAPKRRQPERLAAAVTTGQAGADSENRVVSMPFASAKGVDATRRKCGLEARNFNRPLGSARSES